MLVLSEKEIRKIYSMKECLEDVERAFRYYTEGKTVTPVRTAIQHEKDGADTLVMPSYVEAIGHTAVKVVGIFPKNKEKGKKVIQGMTLLADAVDGKPVSLLDAGYLTMLRTGAASGVATKHLARPDSKVCAVLGCGTQSMGQVMAMMEVLSLERIVLYNRTRERAGMLRQWIHETYPDWQGTVEIAYDSNQAVEMADVVICSTKSATPIFDGTILKAGTHINAIGSYLPHMQEVDATTLKRSSKVIVDTKEGALHEAGDLIIPVKTGEWSFERLYGEIGEIVTGSKKGRENEEEITLFKSVGVAFLDAVVAHAVYQKAKELRTGIEIEW